ncbi:MAG: hypothetical protein GX550_03775 [Syntrophomonadaceae bacterium]|nr:hypothetical protein [Syntrophomonadaceae bacterium]
MQLQKGEHAILSYFNSSNQAQQALEQLRKAGLVPDSESAKIDSISMSEIAYTPDYNSPINDDATLSGVTIFLDPGMAANLNPAAQAAAPGFGYSRAGTVGGKPFLLTLVTDSVNYSKARDIIRANGGHC